MREIKFRQRNKNNGQWHEWGLVQGQWVNPREQDNYVAPQESDRFTGLKDKNDSEIFEGDIISCIWDGFSYEDIGPSKQVVKVDERGLAYGYFPFVVPPGTRGKYVGDFEIIGNIYEHGHLLDTGSHDKI